MAKPLVRLPPGPDPVARRVADATPPLPPRHRHATATLPDARRGTNLAPRCAPPLRMGCRSELWLILGKSTPWPRVGASWEPRGSLGGAHSSAIGLRRPAARRALEPTRTPETVSSPFQVRAYLAGHGVYPAHRQTRPYPPTHAKTPGCTYLCKYHRPIPHVICSGIFYSAGLCPVTGAVL